MFKKLIAIVVVTGFVFSANADVLLWDGPDGGDWSVVANWYNATADAPATSIPGGTDNPLIQSGEAQVTTSGNIAFDVRPATDSGAVRIMNGGDLLMQQCKIGAHGGDGAFYIEAGGLLEAAGGGGNFEVGKESGIAEIVQTGGTVIIGSPRIELGDDAGTTGIYDISAGTLTGNCYTQYSIGNGGIGEFYVSGTADVSLNKGGGGDVPIALGVQPGAEGLLDISGGTMFAEWTAVLGYGEGATGTVNISGGQNYFGRDVITGYVGLWSCGNGNAYFRIEGSGSPGDFIKVDRQFKLDRGQSSTVEFVLDSNGVIPILSGVSYGGATNIGFYADGDTTIILDVTNDFTADVGDTFLLAAGPVVSMSSPVIVENQSQFLYDFELAVVPYSDPNYTPTQDVNALMLAVTKAPVGVITETDGETKIYEEGETTDTFSVALKSQPDPGTQVTVTITYPEGDIKLIDPNTLVFDDSNWDIPQDVDVTAFDGAGYEASDENGNPEEDVIVQLSAASDDPDFDGVPVGEVVVIAVDNECGPGRYLPADLDQNCEINLGDLAVLGGSWLDCSIPGKAGCLEPWNN